MTTMIEKVARALLASESGGDLKWEELDLITRGAFKRDARAALTALLEPTEAMAAAGSARGAYPEDLRIYDKMIQAALDEKEGV